MKNELTSRFRAQTDTVKRDAYLASLSTGRTNKRRKVVLEPAKPEPLHPRFIYCVFVDNDRFSEIWRSIEATVDVTEEYEAGSIITIGEYFSKMTPPAYNLDCAIRGLITQVADRKVTFNIIERKRGNEFFTEPYKEK